jgi:transcriptional regulator with XRE-family HTH domain
MIEIGKAIRIVRRAKEVKVGDLAKRAGVSTPFLSLIEKGERQPSLRVVRQIAQALEVPPEALFILAQPSMGSLLSASAFTNDLVEALGKLADAELQLRQKLGGRGE